MTTTFENAKVGDKVFSPTFGWGEIDHINMFSKHPINVRFFHDNASSGYTFEGYFYIDLPIQSLFWDRVDIEASVKPVGVKMVNGVEIPDISFKPKQGEQYYVPSPTYPDLYHSSFFYSCEVDYYRSINGLCYPFTNEGKQAAILHTKAMLKQ
jgi:hypothetical protein